MGGHDTPPKNKFLTTVLKYLGGNTGYDVIIKS